MAPAVAPAKLAHIVLRTARFEESVGWWKFVLGAHATHETPFLAFLTYDDEHHRIAILHNPALGEATRAVPGLEHVAFTYETLDDLLATYERLKQAGIHPVLTINHGMTFSMYFADPDGNQVELRVDTLSVGDAVEFMESDTFAANPLGVEFDPDDIVRRRAAGEPVEALVRYVPA